MHRRSPSTTAYEEEELPEFGADGAGAEEELPAPKCSKVMGTAVYLPRLQRRCDRSKAVSSKRQKLATRDARGQVTGKTKDDELKSSEHYCITFGRFVANCHKEYVESGPKESGPKESAPEENADNWVALEIGAPGSFIRELSAGE